jgi:5-carboxymethyl-2-hydroxymuconate isomerase
MPDEEQKRQVKVYLLASVQDKLKSLAATRKTSMSAVIADLVTKAA